MDARAELRRLLQQRLESGESTIVLDSLKADVILSAAKDLHFRPRFVQQVQVLRSPEAPSG